MRLLPQTIRGEFALFALSLALPLVGPIGYGLYDRDRARDDIAASEAIARRLAESNADRVSEYVAELRATLEAPRFMADARNADDANRYQNVVEHEMSRI